jgi:hypothetical protein
MKIWFLTLLVAGAAAAQDKGPKLEDGDLAYADFPRFVRDMELACYGIELSGAEALPLDKQAERFSKWLAAQGLGPDFKAIWEALGDAGDGANKSRVFIAAATDANLGRCPWGELYFQSAAVELRGRCAKKDAAACAVIPEFEKDVDGFVHELTTSAGAECKKGRKAQCALPAEFEKMRVELRAGAKAPKAPARLRKGLKPVPAE